MLSSLLAMQNAMTVNNMAALEMTAASDRMLSSAVNFGNSQPLRPSFSSLCADELSIKANETKMSVAQKLMDALSKKTADDCKRSIPKFGGIDYKA